MLVSLLFLLLALPLALARPWFTRESVTYLRNVSDVGFGRAIALPFSQAVVCASGVAHVYRRRHASLSYDPVQSLEPPSGATDFCSVAASSYATLALTAGDSVYLYTMDKYGNWTHEHTLTPPAAFSGFGATLELGGGLIFVGAPQYNNSGCVFAYHDSPPHYREYGYVCPRNFSGVPVNALFGTALSFNAFDGKSVLIVGAPGTNQVYAYRLNDRKENGFEEFGEEYGLVYVPQWPQPDDAQFGAAVALDSFWLMIGAPGRLEDRFYEHTGAVYVYRYSTATHRFEHSMKIRRKPLELYSYFGANIELLVSAGVGVISAPGNGGNAVYQVFLENGDWDKVQRFEGLSLNTTYGSALALDYNGFVTAAPADPYFNELNVTASQGVVYAYELHYPNAATALESLFDMFF